MAKIYIDNQPHTVKDGQNLLEACLSLGFDVPYFCWHPALNSVGACRLCAVKMFKDDKDTRGKIVMSCMTAARDGTRILLADDEVLKFRRSVIEWLMTSHPHDCVVCDEGGECHLQDMTVMTGHVYRRYRFTKRTHRNQDLGPLLTHEMNRCIQCYRCVRFYRDYAGGRDLDVFGWHEQVYFGRHSSGTLESEFAGNLAEVCPTGVFTDKTLAKHYARKWDLQTAPSICVHCGLGCNTIPGERYGTLRRIRNRYNGEVNGYFLCDRGRFGYEFVNDSKRLRQPMLRRDGELQQAGVDETLKFIASAIRQGGGVVGVGSARASLESNFALRRLVGAENFSMGLTAAQAGMLKRSSEIMQSSRAAPPSLREIAASDAVLVLGEDVTNSSPMIALALRQSVLQQPSLQAQKAKIDLWNDAAVRQFIQQQRGPLFVAFPAETRLDDQASGLYRAAPADIARLGFAVANKLDPSLPAVEGISADTDRLAAEIAGALRESNKPLVLAGVCCGEPAVLEAASTVAAALSKVGKKTKLCLTQQECNSLGLGLMGGIDLQAVLEALQSGRAQTLIILENDLYRRCSPEFADEVLGAAKTIIVLDCLDGPTVQKAAAVLPAATFAEAHGTLVNYEGRAQRFYQVFVPQGEVRSGWQWLIDAAAQAGSAVADKLRWNTIDDVHEDLAAELPIFQPVLQIAPPAGFRVHGLRVPRQPQRYSGRTAMHANVSVVEPRAPLDKDSPLAFSMEGLERQPPSPLIPRFWWPGWNSPQAVNKFQQEIGGALKEGGDPGRRLIEGSGANQPQGEQMQVKVSPPPRFEPRDGQLLVVGLYHTFGSEQLSSLSPGVAERSPSPYLAVNERMAKHFSAAEGTQVTIACGGWQITLPVRLMNSMADGLAGVGVGLAGTEALELPAWATVSNSGQAQVQGGRQ